MWEVCALLFGVIFAISQKHFFRQQGRPLRVCVKIFAEVSSRTSFYPPGRKLPQTVGGEVV